MKNKLKIISLYACVTLVLILCVFSIFAFGSIKVFSIAGKTFALPFYVSIILIPLFYVSYILFFDKNRLINRLIIVLCFAFIILFVSSLSMGFILYPKFNGLFDTSPTKVVVINAAKYAYDLSIIPCFVYIFAFLNKKMVKRIFYSCLIIWVLFGMFQIICYYINNNVLWKIYDGIDLLGIISGKSDVFSRIRINYSSFRFYGVSSEPASNAILISVFIVPFLVNEIKIRKGIHLLMPISLLAFSLLFAFLTKSSSVYVALLIIIVYYAMKLFFLNNKIKFTLKLVVSIIAIVSFFVFLIITFIRGNNSIIVSAFLKLIDTSNYSTQHRYSTIWNDILIFIKYPLFGIGDGNQGYYYSKHVIGTWMANNSETQDAIKGKLGLLNGGSGIPSLISGFGVAGCTVIVIAYKYAHRLLGEIKETNKTIKSLYKISLVVMLVLLISTQSIHRNYSLFIILSMISLFSGRILKTNNEFCFSIELGRQKELYEFYTLSI